MGATQHESAELPGGTSLYLALSAQAEGVHDELVQLDELFASAVEQLSQAAFAIDQQLSKVRGTSTHDALGSEFKRLVTALQFQDVASQLIRHMGRRVDALQGALQALNGETRALATPNPVSAAWLALAEAPECAPVRQRSLDAGEALLF